MKPVAQLVAGEWREARLLMHRVAVDQFRFDRRQQALDEVICKLLGDDEALRRGSTLPGIGETGSERCRHSALEVGVVEDDERVAAAEVQRHLLALLAGQRRDLAAGAPAAAEAHRGDHRRGDDTRHLRRSDLQRAEGARRTEPLAQQLVDGQRALGHRAGVLEHHAVASEQRRNGGAEHQPEGCVARCDGEEDAEWGPLEEHPVALAVGELLMTQVVAGRAREMLAEPGAVLDLL
jgi:hypothetical protein